MPGCSPYCFRPPARCMHVDEPLRRGTGYPLTKSIVLTGHSTPYYNQVAPILLLASCKQPQGWKLNHNSRTTLSDDNVHVFTSSTQVEASATFSTPSSERLGSRIRRLIQSEYTLILLQGELLSASQIATGITAARGATTQVFDTRNQCSDLTKSISTR
jgi:hypothetical protein